MSAVMRINLMAKCYLNLVRHHSAGTTGVERQCITDQMMWNGDAASKVFQAWFQTTEPFYLRSLDSIQHTLWLLLINAFYNQPIILFPKSSLWAKLLFLVEINHCSCIVWEHDPTAFGLPIWCSINAGNLMVVTSYSTGFFNHCHNYVIGDNRGNKTIIRPPLSPMQGAQMTLGHGS